MDMLNIGEVARRSNMQTSAIRYYESIGLLSAPQRIGGWRSYQPDVLARLKAIRVARDMGFTLDEIHTLLDGFPMDTPPSGRWQALASQKLAEVNDYIDRANALKRLLEAGLNCECVQIEDCFGDGASVCPPEEVGSESSLMQSCDTECA